MEFEIIKKTKQIKQKKKEGERLLIKRLSVPCID